MRAFSDWTAEKRLDAALRGMLAALAVQVAISWRAWAPGERGFPRVPVLETWPPGTTLPDGLLLALGGAGMLWLLRYPRSVAGAGILLGAALLLVMGDVNRLQPWLYLYGVLLLGMQFVRTAGRGLDLVRWGLACTWFWSGTMKLNAGFAEGYFPGLMAPFGLDEWAAARPEAAYLAGAWEATAGILCCFPRMRRAGLGAGLGVHAFILASLGPWGLSWNEVVWPWNLAFMWLAVMSLTGPRAFRTALRPRWAETGMILLLGVMPLLNYAGRWDHFLSHSFYSGRVPDTVFYFHPDDRFHLPAPARPQVRQSSDGEEFLLPLELWALDELKTPGYPEIRTRKRVARKLCGCLEFPEKAGLRVHHRLSGAAETLGCLSILPPDPSTHPSDKNHRITIHHLP